MPIVVRPQTAGLLEAVATPITVKVLLLPVEKLVLLQGRLAEEPLGAEGADKRARLLLLLPRAVHVVLVLGQHLKREFLRYSQSQELSQ